MTTPNFTPEVPQWCYDAYDAAMFQSLRRRGAEVIYKHAPRPEAKEVAVLESMLANEEQACMEVLKERDTAIGFCDLFASTILGEDINWPCHETKWQEALDMLSNGKTIEVSGIMLRRSGDYAIVEAEVDGKWKEVIREYIDAPFSHIVEPAGIADAKESELNSIPDGVEATPAPAADGAGEVPATTPKWPRYAKSEFGTIYMQRIEDDDWISVKKSDHPSSAEAGTSERCDLVRGLLQSKRWRETDAEGNALTREAASAHTCANCDQPIVTDPRCGLTLCDKCDDTTSPDEQQQASGNDEQANRKIIESNLSADSESFAVDASREPQQASGVETSAGVETRTQELRTIVKNVLEDATRTICYEVRRSSGEFVTAADHDAAIADRDATIAKLQAETSHWHEELGRIAHQFRVAVDPGNVQKLNPEGNAKLAVEFRTRAEAAEAKCAEYRDTFTTTNEMRLSEVRLRHQVQQRAELAELHCTGALDRLEVANAQLAELRAERERMRALLTAHCDLLDQIWFHIPFTDVPAWDHKREKAINECLKAVLGNRRTGRTMLSRDEIRQQILPRLAAAETGVAK